MSKAASSIVTGLVLALLLSQGWREHASALDRQAVAMDARPAQSGAYSLPASSAPYDTWLPMPHGGFSAFGSAFAVQGKMLYIGGSLGGATIDNAVSGMNSIARLDTTTDILSALPHEGLNNPGMGRVSAMALSGDDLYLGGAWFDQTADGAVTGLNKVARFNTATGIWSALANGGLDAYEVDALALVGTDLYVAGGWMTQTADGAVTGLNDIARYDTLTDTWHALPHDGLNSDYYVKTFAVHGTDLYVGGWFSATHDGAVPGLNSIARFDTLTGTWSSLPNGGLNDEVDKMVFNGSDLYVGGWFSGTYDGAVTGMNSIARFDTLTGTWHALPNQGLNGPICSVECQIMPPLGDPVTSLIFDGSDLYVGGRFSGTYDGALSNAYGIARFDTLGQAWSNLPHTGLAGYANGLALKDGVLYVAGHFQQTADASLPLNSVARLVREAAPTALSLSNNSLDGIQLGNTVGDLSTTDPNIGDQFTYSLCGGPDDALFYIEAGKLKNAHWLDYWSKPALSICIRATDLGGFSFDQAFTVHVNPSARSSGAYDGWVLESSETSRQGGTRQTGGWDLRIGDDASRRQYRDILSFDTAWLPDDAVITQARLQLLYHKQVGPNAFLVLGNILADIQKGPFSRNTALQNADFQARAGRNAVGSLSLMPGYADWYAIDLDSATIPYINLTGITQFRLRFQRDDNNDRVPNQLLFYSGNAPNYSRPALSLQYYVP